MNTINRIFDLSLIWKQASLVFPYFDRLSLDWDKAYKEYLPKVINTKTDLEFHLLLAEFMNLLSDGHTDYMLPKSLRDEAGYLPFSLRFIGDSYFIDTSIPEYEAHLGSRILSINDAPFMSLIQNTKKYAYHIGNYISRYRLTQILPFLLKPTNNRAETTSGAFTFDLLPSRPENLKPQSLHLPVAYEKVQTGKLDIRLYGDILYIKLDDFMYGKAADEVASAITQNPAVSGIIFDLRENVGGMTMNGAKIAELLIAGEFHGCQKRTRSMTGVALASASQIMDWTEDDIKAHIAAGYTTPEEIAETKSYLTNTHFDSYADTYGSIDHPAIFLGPCAVLTSRHTVSAAEDFIAMLRTNRRAAVIGTPTCGTTGTPFMQDLSSGGWMRICSVAYRLMDGTEFIGRGITPDIFSEISEEDFKTGYDSVLNDGLSYIKKKSEEKTSDS